MKKFVFTNEKYQGMKVKEYDRLKLDMENVDKEIDYVTSALDELKSRFYSERIAFESTCKQGAGARELFSYQNYFEFLQEQRMENQRKLGAFLLRKKELTEMLVRVNNELRVLEDMWQEQYQAYCKEAAAEEYKELDNHMAFSIFGRAV